MVANPAVIVESNRAMTAPEARRAVEAIRGHMAEARKQLFDLETRQGWRALGYESWAACVRSEFGASMSQLYRQLKAAKIEQALEGEIGAIPERHLRHLAPLLDDPEALASAWASANRLARSVGRVTVTETIVKAAVDVVQEHKRTDHYDLGEHGQIPQDGAVTLKAYEDIQQQKEILSGKQDEKLLNQLFDNSQDAAIAVAKLAYEGRIRVVVYRK